MFVIAGDIIAEVGKYLKACWSSDWLCKSARETKTTADAVMEVQPPWASELLARNRKVARNIRWSTSLDTSSTSSSSIELRINSRSQITDGIDVAHDGCGDVLILRNTIVVQEGREGIKNGPGEEVHGKGTLVKGGKAAKIVRIVAKDEGKVVDPLLIESSSTAAAANSRTGKIHRTITTTYFCIQYVFYKESIHLTVLHLKSIRLYVCVHSSFSSLSPSFCFLIPRNAFFCDGKNLSWNPIPLIPSKGYPPIPCLQIQGFVWSSQLLLMLQCIWTKDCDDDEDDAPAIMPWGFQ